MATDLLDLYRSMARARELEQALAALWVEGLISGEMHLGTGEEAVAAGVCAHLRDGDAVALDHRASPWMLLRGTDPRALLAECLGRPDGLCGGSGGHMHLLDRQRLAAGSGIVGSSGPLAAGFALAAKHLRPRSVAVATFGEGAVNQGMLLESFNLAVAWSLPVVFVCKDNGWAITTRSAAVTGGRLVERAASFGMPAVEVDGLDPLAVHEAAGEAVKRARAGKGPSFLVCRVSRLDGHMLGDVMLRMASSPIAEGGAALSKAVTEAFSARGGGVVSRAASLLDMTTRLASVGRDHQGGRSDPLVLARKALSGQRVAVERIEADARAEVAEAVAGARGEVMA